MCKNGGCAFCRQPRRSRTIPSWRMLLPVREQSRPSVGGARPGLRAGSGLANCPVAMKGIASRRGYRSTAHSSRVDSGSSASRRACSLSPRDERAGFKRQLFRETCPEWRFYAVRGLQGHVQIGERGPLHNRRRIGQRSSPQPNPLGRWPL